MDTLSHPRREGLRADRPTVRGSSSAGVGRVQAAPYFVWKDAVGRILALFLLAAGLPIIVFSIVLVRLTSPGPGIYRQLRVGRRGRVYSILKIRSMRCDAEKGTGPVWSTQSDPRVTWVGRILRTTHIDEFPQLLNVLKGEMALIGPRPERPEFTQRLAAAIPGYMDRLVVRPGITGLAQINLPPDTDLQSVRRKLALDLEYVAKGNAWLDIRIFLCTFARLFGFNAFAVSRFLGLDRHIRTSQPEAERSPLQCGEDLCEAEGINHGLVKASDCNEDVPTFLDEVT